MNHMNIIYLLLIIDKRFQRVNWKIQKEPSFDKTYIGQVVEYFALPHKQS